MFKPEYKLNKLYIDRYSRKTAILAINKPADITSHDLVDKVRHYLKTRRVGHTGALDPFASGLMIILVGRTTKLSNQFLFMEKEYEFTLLLGISTDTMDPEGKITQLKNIKKLAKDEIYKVAYDFKGIYLQQVPVYSSVKVKGIRLREMAHASKAIEIKNSKAVFTIDEKSMVYKKLKRQNKIDKNNCFQIKLPQRKVHIKDIQVVSIKKIKSNKINFLKDVDRNYNFLLIKMKSTASKGTYIRQLAVDIGKKLGNLPALLYTLKRTKIGDIDIKDAIDVSCLDKLDRILEQM